MSELELDLEGIIANLKKEFENNPNSRKKVGYFDDFHADIKNSDPRDFESKYSEAVTKLFVNIARGEGDIPTDKEAENFFCMGTLDSLDISEMLMEIEDELNILIPEDVGTEGIYDMVKMVYSRFDETDLGRSVKRGEEEQKKFWGNG